MAIYQDTQTWIDKQWFYYGSYIVFSTEIKIYKQKKAGF
jgi:hypothetical protein